MSSHLKIILAWLNSSWRSRVGFRMNRSARSCAYIIITLYFISGAHGGCGVCVGRGWLGVCGSAVVPPLWRLGGFGAVMFGNTAELGGQGFQ